MCPPIMTISHHDPPKLDHSVRSSNPPASSQSADALRADGGYPDAGAARTVHNESATLDPMPWLLHHVQLAIPPGSEDRARAFYGSVLGCEELVKPATLVERGGAWFRYGAVELHLAVEEGHRPSRQAHPGILIGDLDELEARLRAAGYEVETDYFLAGYRRFYVDDPFGNRLEFLAVL